MLGTASSQEQQEVECMSHIYPEIAKELEKLTSSIEVKSLEKEQSTPTGSMDFNAQAIENQAPQQPTCSETESAATEEEAIVGPLPPSEGAGFSGAWRSVALAVCLVGFIGIGTWLISSRSALKQSNETLLALQAELKEANEAQTKLRSSLNDQRLKLTSQATQLSVLKAQETHRVTLVGTANAPNARVEVFWNPDLEIALIGATALPTLPSNQHYQLWAFADGVAENMGVFELDPSKPDLQRMADVTHVQTFAISIEPRGGSVSPNLDTLVVIGKV